MQQGNPSRAVIFCLLSRRHGDGFRHHELHFNVPVIPSRPEFARGTFRTWMIECPLSPPTGPLPILAPGTRCRWNGGRQNSRTMTRCFVRRNGGPCSVTVACTDSAPWHEPGSVTANRGHELQRDTAGDTTKVVVPVSTRCGPALRASRSRRYPQRPVRPAVGHAQGGLPGEDKASAKPKPSTVVCSAGSCRDGKNKEQESGPATSDCFARETPHGRYVHFQQQCVPVCTIAAMSFSFAEG